MVECSSLAVYSNSKRSGAERWNMDLRDELSRRILHAMIHRSSRSRDGPETTIPLKHILVPTSIVVKAALGAFGLVEKKEDTGESTPEADVIVESSEVSANCCSRRALRGVRSISSVWSLYAHPLFLPALLLLACHR